MSDTNPETKTDHFESGLATLSADATPEFDSSAPWKINGVAIPVNTIVNGGQNVDHFFPAEVLQDAGRLLEDAPIVKNFHELQGQASADEVIGKVTNAGFQKGVGLVFEGEITDREIAEKIAHGFLDVSPTPARSLGAFDESMDAQRVDRLVDFRDIAVVANGQPGARVEIGSNPTVGALAADVLSRGFDTLRHGLTIHTPEFSDTTTGEWDSPDLEDFTDESWADVDDDAKTTIGNHFIGSQSGFPAENFGDMFLPVVDPDGNLNLSALQNAKARAGQVSGLSGDDLDRAISIINGLANDNFDAEFDTDSDSDSVTETDTNAESADSGADTQSDDPETASSVAEVKPTDTMSDNSLTDDEKAVLAAAEGVENATDVLNAYSAAEQPEIVESDVLNQTNEQLEELASVFRDALADRTGLSEEAVNAMPVDALANEFRNEDGEIEAETLSQTPETQTPAQPETGTGTGASNASAGIDALSRSERQNVKNKLDKIKLLRGRVSDDYLDALKSDAAEIAGVESAEEINYEAL